ncbi:MAG: bacterioferritin [Rhodocyclales bacterium RIFCSPLOWO2_02_FULL_63_24]|nr:MAG: bacterioferritin [Rhodocyclales bacterium GWA2_65_20]OHC69310.1 MAG: bacterioferritin [Rhodocyclales bacterium RIFCSPLOWO2_02_FULL_63_24]
MKGETKIIASLNSLLAGELTAIDQYFIHSEMLANWGLHRLAERLRHEVEDERGHARALIARILFLEGVPDLATRAPLAVGKDVPHMLKNDLAVELDVVKALRAAIAECEKLHDYVTREMLEQLLEDTEEDHAHWLEQQLGLIRMVGQENYIQSQMGSPPGTAT